MVWRTLSQNAVDLGTLVVVYNGLSYFFQLAEKLTLKVQTLKTVRVGTCFLFYLFSVLTVPAKPWPSRPIQVEGHVPMSMLRLLYNALKILSR